MKTLGEELAKFKNAKDLNRELRASYEEAKRDEKFRELVDQIPFGDDELMKYTSILEDCVTEHKSCLKCKSLLECKNPVAGHALTPIIIDGKLEFSYQPCKYQIKFNEQNSYLKNIELIEVSNELKNANMKDIFKDDASRLEALEWILNFIKNYPNCDKGMYLYGNFGCGKTYLIAAMFNELAKKGVKSAIVYYPEFLREVKASFGTGIDKVEQLKKIPLLLLDDIGAENTTDWGRDEILGPILQYRMQMNLKTFFTSNFDLESLEEHFSVSRDKISTVKAKRIMERITFLTDTVKIVGKNRRKN